MYTGFPYFFGLMAKIKCKYVLPGDVFVVYTYYLAMSLSIRRVVVPKVYRRYPPD